MGGDGHPRVGPIGMIGWQRLGAEHIQRGMADLACVQCRQKRIIVDQRAASGVDDDSTARQQRQTPGIKNINGFRRLRQQAHQDFRLCQRPVQPVRPVLTVNQRQGPGAVAPPGHREIQRRQRQRRRPAQFAQPQHRHRAFARQGRHHRIAPDPVLPVDMGVHPQMMAQHMAHDIFDHAFGQFMVDHAAQRLGQRRVARIFLDPRPQAQHRLAAGKGGEIADRATGGKDDIIDHRRVGCPVADHHIQPEIGTGGRQQVAVVAPVRRARREKYLHHHGATLADGHGRFGSGQRRP